MNPRINAGKYRLRGAVKRLRADAAKNAAGHVDETLEANWETFCKRSFHEESLPARDRLNLRESLVGDQTTSGERVILTTRSDNVSRAFDSSMKIVIGRRTLQISGPPRDVDALKQEVEIVCIELE